MKGKINYKALVESSFDCICQIDHEGKITYMNPFGACRLGFSTDTIECDLTKGLNNDYVPIMLDAFKLAKKGETVSLEYETFAPGGGSSWWESKLGPIKNENNLIIGIVRVSRDITQRKKAEKDLMETKEFLEAMIENSAEAIITTGRDGRITSWNKGAENLLGFTKDEIIGKSIFSLYPDGLKENRRDQQQSILDGFVLRDLKTKIYNSDYVLVDINLTLSPLYDNKSHVIGSVSVSRNLLDAIESEKKLREKITELERWQKLTVGRELKMIELKEEMKKLKERLKIHGETYRN